MHHHLARSARLLIFAIVSTTVTTAAAQAPTPEPPPLQPGEAEGRCATPRQAWYQLLFWLQQGKQWDPARAAACFDGSALADPAEASALAVQLKRVLDARGLWVPVEALPIDPGYRNLDGLPIHVLLRDELGGVNVVRKDERWLFSSGTVARIPELYEKMVPSGMESLVRSFPAPLKIYVVGVQLWQLIGVLFLVILALAVQKIVLWLLANHARKLFQRIGTGWISKTMRHLDRPLAALAMAGVLRVGVPVLGFPIGVSRVALVATSALAASALVWMAYRFIDVLGDWLEAKAAATETKLDDQLVPLVSRSLKVFVAAVGAMFILQNFNVDVGSLLAGLGLGGLAFALAAKDTVANFFGSLTIFIDKPFQIGDWVVISGFEGNIEEVGFRTTRIRTFYNSLLTVPNSTIAATVVDNYGARRYRRYKTFLKIDYNTSPEKVQAFLEGIRASILALPGMRKDYFMIEFDGFTESGLSIQVYSFMETPTWVEELRVRTWFNLEILRLAKELGISFAFPTRTLHVESLPPMGAAAGSARPEPQDPGVEELARVVAAFGPGGKLARPAGVPISEPPPGSKS